MAEAAAPPVRYEVSDGVATITLDRPEARNSLTRTAKVALLEAVHSAAGDLAVRAVVLTGAGRAFSVGQDLREHAAALKEQPLDVVWSTVTEHYAPIALGLATMAKPVVAAVNGVAAGAGASLVFACDFRLLAESAAINTAFAGIGLSCDTGASWTLPRLVGHARATELLMLPRTVSAAEAEQLGLATRVVPDAELASTARAFARGLADGPTLAYASIKSCLGLAATTGLPAALAAEASAMARTGGSRDHREAVQAFLAKRAPQFTGD
ncbi:MAG: enoyl-CoA hydratase-related protein [Nocardioidaceae bacterium]